MSAIESHESPSREQTQSLTGYNNLIFVGM